MGMILRPAASGIRVHLFVDASYGVHVDGRSHTGSCVVIGDLGLSVIKADNSDQEFNGSGLSDSANQGLFLRNFLRLQGYSIPAVIDNMALLARGERNSHIDRRYFWMKERVDKGEATIVHKRTCELYARAPGELVHL
jgi:hypothetical protein